MGNLAAGGGFKRDVDGLSPPADAGVTRATKRELHQGENGVNKTLRRAQREAKDAFEHQYGGNSELRIMLRTAPRRSFWFIIPGLNGRLIKPECQ